MTISIVSAKQRGESEGILELALAKVWEWADSGNARLNPQKCSYMLFPNGCVSMARRLPHDLFPGNTFVSR